MKHVRKGILDADLVKLISETAIEEYKKHEKQEIKLKRDKRLHNVKKLMTNYNRIKESVNRKHIREDSDISIEEIMASEFMIESLNQSQGRSRMMVEYTDKILTSYKHICEIEGEPYRYGVLVDRYVNNLPIHKLSDKYAMSNRTIYRELEKGCEDIAVLLFGVDAIHFSVD